MYFFLAAGIFGATNGQSTAAKNAYYEPVPQKMDFPTGVKHQNQLIDYKTVVWLTDHAGSGKVMQFLATTSEKGGSNAAS